MAQGATDVNAMALNCAGQLSTDSFVLDLKIHAW